MTVLVIVLAARLQGKKNVTEIWIFGRGGGAPQPHQRAAWFMLHRIHEGWKQSDGVARFSGPVEVDET